MAALHWSVATPPLLALTLSVRAAAGVGVSTQTVYSGMCDASAAVALDATLFVVANDEDNALRIYRATSGGPAVASQNFATFLEVDPQKPETDLEGACWLGDRIFWITSHGRNQDGKFRLNRHCFFATSIRQTAAGPRLALEGRVYRSLLSDLLREPRLRPFKLEAASRLPPKDRGALNIEGLCPTPEGHLLVGFRNPIPQQMALLVPVLNADEVIAGRPARLGEPRLLDLGGLGIRELARWRDGYLIVAGAYNGKGKSRLYSWAGGESRPERVRAPGLKDLNPEAIVVYPGKPEAFQLLSDDGTALVNGMPCKRVPDPALRRFRSVWVQWPAPAP